jgi:hypothetical protein
MHRRSERFVQTHPSRPQDCCSLLHALADEGAGVLLAARFGGGALQTGAARFDELIRRTQTPCRSLRGACIRKRKPSARFEISLLNADRRFPGSSERRAGLRRADPPAWATSAAIRSTGSTLTHAATRQAAANDGRTLTAEARIACPTDIRRCVVRTDDFACGAGRPIGSVAALASLTAGLVDRLTHEPTVMLPRGTIIAADRSGLGTAKPGGRAQREPGLAVAFIWIAAAARRIGAVTAASRVLTLATNRVGRAAPVATRHQAIWTAIDTAARAPTATEAANTQCARDDKAD